jgi:hypothetical protein
MKTKAFKIQFKQDGKVLKDMVIEATNVREATSIALNLVVGLFYWDEIKVESL